MCHMTACLNSDSFLCILFWCNVLKMNSSGALKNVFETALWTKWYEQYKLAFAAKQI